MTQIDVLFCFCALYQLGSGAVFRRSGGSSEMIVPKKPKNLFMMMDFQRGFSAKTAEDEYNFDEHEEEEFGSKPGFDYREPRKCSPTPSVKSRDSLTHYQEWTDEDLHHSSPAVCFISF